MAIAVVVFAAIITASLAMQKSFNAVDNYFTTHIQQVRIIDYLNRDVKRALIVTTSADHQTVTLTIPKYIIECGDADADAVCTGNPPTAPAGSNIGKPRTPSTNGSQVNYCTTGITTSTVIYSISGNSILRTEDTGSGPVLTTIASSTDQLVPATTDTDQANTEYTNMAVTFQPIFTSGNAAAARTGTTVFSLAYLRNKRRG